MPRNLDLALIGNGAIGLLVDSHGAIVWGCFPRFDGDATFCALLDHAPPGDERGIYAVEMVGVGQRAAGDERDRAVQAPRQCRQQRGNAGVHAHAIRGGR